MTGQAVVNAALELLHVSRPGYTPSTVDSNSGLAILNRLLDSWSTDRLLIPVVTSNSYALTAATASYAIGPSASSPFNVARPIRIDTAGIVQASYNSGAVSFRSELKLITEAMYQAITDKTATADVPEMLYYAPTPGNGTLILWPIPNVSSSTQLELSTWSPLTAFPDLTTDIALAAGYQRAIVTNLAIECASEFPAAQLDQSTIADAQQSKMYIMQLNSFMVPMAPDMAIPPQTNEMFNPVPSTVKAVASAKANQQNENGGS